MKPCSAMLATPSNANSGTSHSAAWSQVKRPKTKWAEAALPCGPSRAVSWRQSWRCSAQGAAVRTARDVAWAARIAAETGRELAHLPFRPRVPNSQRRAEHGAHHEDAAPGLEQALDAARLLVRGGVDAAEDQEQPVDQSAPPASERAQHPHHQRRRPAELKPDRMAGSGRGVNPCAPDLQGVRLLWGSLHRREALMRRGREHPRSGRNIPWRDPEACVLGLRRGCWCCQPHWAL
mmetsp:Transcript_74169/g.234255  ORF Transcript_74169/g.234255 Transcript_74169/m.234255 type:complete len:235 (-) Transcript_74169:130-834(-)